MSKRNLRLCWLWSYYDVTTVMYYTSAAHNAFSNNQHIISNSTHILYHFTFNEICKIKHSFFAHENYK